MQRLVRFAIALILAASLGQVYAATPEDLAGCTIGRIWSFDSGAEGWAAGNNVSGFQTGDGVLRFVNKGPDPGIANSNPQVDTDRFHFLSVRMRTNHAGENQVYFATDRSPSAGEDKVLCIPVIGDGRFHTYTLDMSTLKSWSGMLTWLRLDAANGGDEEGAKVEIDWIALYQTPAQLSIGRPYASMEAGAIAASIPMTNVGGSEFTEPIVISDGDARQEIPGLKPHETATPTLRLPSASEAIRVTAVSGGKTLLVAELASPAVTATPGDQQISSLPLTARNGSVVVGQLRPLATLAVRTPSGSIRYIELTGDTSSRSGADLVMSSTRKIEGADVTVRWRFTESPARDTVTATVHLSTTAPLQVLRFEGPRLLAGEGSFGAHKSRAILPGLEYLDTDEPSSAVKHIGPKLADRHAPHPYKITSPFMVVEADGVYAGVRWDPNRRWAPGKALPCAEFESPCKSGANHLMSLFVPSIPDYVDENGDFARTPYTLLPGSPISLSMTFFTGSGTIEDNLARIMPRPAPTPPVPYGLEGTVDICMKGLTQSLYSTAAKGWKTHIGLDLPFAANPPFAATILGESLRSGDTSLPERCDIPADAQLTSYTGTTLDWFSADRRDQAEGTIAEMSDDGGFPYSVTPDMVKKIAQFNNVAGVDAKDLGDVGSTNSGLIAVRLQNLITYALLTGNERATAAALKSVQKMNSFSVPRGAQIWEVHAHAPDVYAAGVSIDCNLAAYVLTGDKRYIERAAYWARTGVPFVYTWVPPIDPIPSKLMYLGQHGEGTPMMFGKAAEFYADTRRRINPGASIAVFGTSFYFMNWFANPVQWCGLAYAGSADRYLRYAPNDSVVRRAADAVFASATQQMPDKGILAGTYTDAWSLRSNSTSAIYIEPTRILDQAYNRLGEKRPTDIRSEGFARGGARSVLNTFAIIDRLRPTTDGVQADLRFYAGQDLWTCVTRAAKPVRVTVDGVDIPKVSDLRKEPSGYWFDDGAKALHIKYRPGARNTTLAITW